MMETKRCSVSYIVPGTDDLPSCKRPVVKTCEGCNRGFCEYHAQTEMVGNLCRACMKPSELGGN